ncbi:MAG: hypothetical protein WBV71_04730 [Roseobacter sp.]
MKQRHPDGQAAWRALDRQTCEQPFPSRLPAKEALAKPLFQFRMRLLFPNSEPLEQLLLPAHERQTQESKASFGEFLHLKPL